MKKDATIHVPKAQLEVKAILPGRKKSLDPKQQKSKQIKNMKEK